MNDPGAPLLFTDGKSPEALRTIGELADALGIRQHVLRYWEEQFPALKPLKRAGNRRYYRPDDVRLIEAIDRLVHRDGYTIKGARAFLEGRSSAGDEVSPANHFAPRIAGPSDSQIQQGLTTIRNQLAAALLSTAR
jgi:DNA-binding transcriptional MerR regulator